MKYSRYTRKIEFRLRPQTREMLEELSIASKKSISEICRDIIESSVLRRHKKLMENSK